jgi:hypothetical protein
MELEFLILKALGVLGLTFASLRTSIPSLWMTLFFREFEECSLTFTIASLFTSPTIRLNS